MPSNAQNLSLQLTASDYNGYNISCFGVRDGEITLTITGGTPPYSILWSTRDSIENLTGLASGYYRVEVTDASPASTPVSAEITLTEPEALRVNLTFSSYQINGREYNISLNGACNGWIAVNPNGGVEPYSYQWEQLNGSNLQTVTNLCAMEYLVQVTDANGCMQENIKQMTEPARDDWTMSGNTGSDAEINFIGTNDAQDLVIKTNSEERLRIKADGNILINRFSGGAGMAYFDSLGRLQTGNAAAPCNNVQPVWESANPFLIYACSPNRVAIGDYSIPSAARFYVDGQTHLNGNLGIGTAASNSNVRLTVSGTSLLDGDVGIGMLPQAGYHLTVDGKVGVREVYVRATGAWPDYVFDAGYELMTLKETGRFIKTHKHLPGMKPAAEVETEGQPLGDIQKQQQEHLEKLYLYILQLEQRIEVLEKRK